ncbi:MAG: xanthine dehydrogenase family protein molybdopterin-binding subunit [Acidimicrobiia bacterium]|nr:xanthine dehydrogenase family protein molybdopterin-binding subunit [Acidimicrobiia bacterium]
MSAVGDRLVRVDALAKVTGAQRFPSDLSVPDALSALVVFSDQPHARMTAMDTSAAGAVPGVVAVFTAADVPVNEYGLTMFDQPVLVGLGGTGRSPVASDVSRWEGDQIAVVVAENQEAAQRGAAALAVDWEPLPLCPDVDSAMTAGAPLLHPEDGHGSNAYKHYRIRKGDMAAGWAAADAVVKATYTLPHQEHAYLQPEAAVAYVDDHGRVTVEVAGQWTHEDQEQIAHALDLPADRIRVIYPAIGGAFGGREDMSLQIVMALAAWRLHEQGETRPVRCVWSREESIVGHHKRHRARVHARWGATADGRIVAAEADAWLDAGAYNYTSNKVLGNLHLTLIGPYRIPNARVDSSAVYTTSVPGGAFRGFGGPQGTFVSESQINKLAEALGMDPVELRRRNLIADGEPGPTHTPLPEGVSIDRVVDDCAGAAQWPGPHPGADPVVPFRSLAGDGAATRHGRGFACALKNVGFSFGFPERCEAKIELAGDDDDPISATLFHSAAEVGQGAHTALLQMAADAVGLPVEQVHGVFSDTALTGDSGSVSASRMTFMAGNAILGAAEEAQKAWIDGARPAVGEFRYVPPPTDPMDDEGGPSVPNFSYGYVAQSVDLSVDVETGHIRVDRVVSAVDVGRAINPTLIESQTEGAVVQAHGYAMTERLVVEDGRILNPRLSQYLIPGIGDIPTRVDTVIGEYGDPLGPFGARGMAEMPFIPYAAAVVAALHDATGVWFDRFPLTPDLVVETLRAHGVR